MKIAGNCSSWGAETRTCSWLHHTTHCTGSSVCCGDCNQTLGAYSESGGAASTGSPVTQPQTPRARAPCAREDTQMCPSTSYTFLLHLPEPQTPGAARHKEKLSSARRRHREQTPGQTQERRQGFDLGTDVRRWQDHVQTHPPSLQQDLPRPQRFLGRENRSGSCRETPDGHKGPSFPVETRGASAALAPRSTSNPPTTTTSKCSNTHLQSFSKSILYKRQLFKLIKSNI